MLDKRLQAMGRHTGTSATYDFFVIAVRTTYRESSVKQLCWRPGHFVT